ncbi:MAG: dihydropteroate synthase, partial [Gaiellales bacterium]
MDTLVTRIPGPALMGIVNVTPDSFSDGGRFAERDAAIAHGLELVA